MSDQGPINGLPNRPPRSASRAGAPRRAPSSAWPPAPPGSSPSGGSGRLSRPGARRNTPCSCGSARAAAGATTSRWRSRVSSTWTYREADRLIDSIVSWSLQVATVEERAGLKRNCEAAVELCDRGLDMVRELRNVDHAGYLRARCRPLTIRGLAACFAGKHSECLKNLEEAGLGLNPANPSSRLALAIRAIWMAEAFLHHAGARFTPLASGEDGGLPERSRAIGRCWPRGGATSSASGSSTSPRSAITRSR